MLFCNLQYKVRPKLVMSQYCVQTRIRCFEHYLRSYDTDRNGGPSLVGVMEQLKEQINIVAPLNKTVLPWVKTSEEKDL